VVFESDAAFYRENAIAALGLIQERAVAIKVMAVVLRVTVPKLPRSTLETDAKLHQAKS